MDQSINKPINNTSSTGVLNGTTLTTNSSSFPTTGFSYASQTTINNPLHVSGPITYDTTETTYSQSYLHEVAVIAVTRSPEGFIIKSKMVKTMWVETKDGGSIDFTAGKDPEVSKFEPEDIIIKTLRTIKL